MKKSLLFISALVTGAAAFAQSTPNGNFESWTDATTPVDWSSKLTVSGLTSNTLTLTNQDTGYVGTSSIKIHSASLAGKYVPGISISGANAFVHFTVSGTFLAPVVTPSRGGSFPITERPVTLSGFAIYKTTTVTTGTVTAGPNHGAIGVEVFDGADIVGGYSLGEFSIDTTDTWVNFNIPITYTNTATTVDSVRITLGTSLAITTQETPTVGDTLVVDMLRFLSCAIDPSVTLAAPTVVANGGAAAGLSATGTLTLTPNDAYNHTFTFSVPNPSIGQLTQMGFAVDFTITPMDSIVFGPVSTIPGLTFTPGYPGGAAYPNSLYCYSISGNIPATDNVMHQMNIVQTPYGRVHAYLGALSADLGTTDCPIGTLNTPLGPQAIDLTNTAVDSIMIQVGTPIGIADFDVSLGFNVSQNSPNPFDGSTTITFNCAVSGTATFVVTDVLGRQVYDTNINATAGSNTFTYSTDLANGTYFFSLSDGTNTITRTMVVSE